MSLQQSFRSIFPLLFLATINGGISQAQITPDGTIPTVVENLGNMDKITGGERVGNNLFHSFEQFSIPAGRSAVFENAADIQNIFTRITGSEASFIDGLLKTAGGANFFLLNPNGVIFGENARLDVGGSFIATTADSIVFADGNRFAVTSPNQKPLLTINLPIGLDFLGNNGSITVNGSGNQITNDSNFAPIEFGGTTSALSVNDGQTLALVGNGINFNGGVVTTEGGQIYLNSVESGEVSINQTETGLTFSDDGVTKYQDINLNQQSLIDASGETVGSISLIGENINFNNASFLLSQNQGDNPGGEINIKASESLNLSGSSPDGEISSRIRSEVLNTAGATGTNLNISSNQLILQNIGTIQTATFSSSADSVGGDINIKTVDAVNLNDGVITTGTFAEGNAGNINLSTSALQISNTGSIFSSTATSPNSPNVATGNGGNITITADLIKLSGSRGDASSTISSSSLSDGDSGNLTVTTKNLQVEDGGAFSASSFGRGNAGNITINASDSVSVSGKNNNLVASDNPETTIRAAVESASPSAQRIFRLPEVPTGNAGTLTIKTPLLNISHGGVVSVRNEGTGSAGTLTISTNTLNLDEVGRITAAASSGLGGNILLNTDSLNISNDSKITTTAAGNNDGGNITINTTNLSAKKNSQITANSLSGDGGNITINADSIFLNSRDTIAAQSSSGDGGNIRINADRIQLENNSNISASAGGQGDGGNITINTDFLIANPSENSDITANAEFGTGGDISIKAIDVIGIQFREELTELSDITASSDFGLEGTVAISSPDNRINQIEFKPTPDFIDANATLANSYCKAVRESSFIVTGRGGLPLAPEGEILPEYIWEDWRIIDSETIDNAPVSDDNYTPVTATPYNRIQPVQGWYVNSRGQVVLTAEPIMLTPQAAMNKRPGCRY